MSMKSPPQLIRRILWIEASILIAAVLYYELGTFFLRADPAVGHAHAISLWNLERRLGIFVEPWFQSVFGQDGPVLWLLVFFYVGPHFVLTLGFFAWAYWYRFPSYPHVRNSFLAFTFLAFGFQWLYPLSPPRLVPEAGLVDSLEQTLPVSGNTPWIMQFTNPYAALPSVHFGWALLVCILAIRLSKGPYRWLWTVYPTMIGLSILATGNHWLLDLVLTVVFIAWTEAVLAWLERRHWTPHSSAPKPFAFWRAKPQPVEAEAE
jgi:hypothetical protein